MQARAQAQAQARGRATREREGGGSPLLQVEDTLRLLRRVAGAHTCGRPPHEFDAYRRAYASVTPLAAAVTPPPR